MKLLLVTVITVLVIDVRTGAEAKAMEKTDEKTRKEAIETELIKYDKNSNELMDKVGIFYFQLSQQERLHW